VKKHGWRTGGMRGGWLRPECVDVVGPVNPGDPESNSGTIHGV
jgi:hypothetical protein